LEGDTYVNKNVIDNDGFVSRLDNNDWKFFHHRLS
jgi:hypothetical protein